MSRAASKNRAEKGRGSSTPAPPPPTQSQDVVDIVPGRLTESNWVSMVSQEEGEEVVVDILDELVNHVMKRCYQVYLQRQLVPFTVSWARDSLVQILEWRFLIQDEGEGPANALPWQEDSEPQPTATDSWAQGCVSVVQSRPTTNLQQRLTPVGEAVDQKGLQSNQRCQLAIQADSPQRHSRKDKKQRETKPGFRGVKLIPARPAKIELERTPHPPQSTLNDLPAQDGLQLQHRSPRGSVSEEQEAEGEEDPNSLVSKYQPPPWHQSLQAVTRLDPGRLPRHCVWPQYEVLACGPSRHHFRKSLGASDPSQERETRHIKQAEPLKLLTNSEEPTNARGRCGLAGPVCLSFRRRPIQHGSQAEGVIPFSESVLLSSMELSPGVTIRGPQGSRASPSKGNLSQLEHHAELKPIRTSLPVPLFPLDQLMAGPPPHVTPL